jgi:hypothetical protein
MTNQKLLKLLIKHFNDKGRRCVIQLPHPDLAILFAHAFPASANGM